MQKFWQEHKSLIRTFIAGLPIIVGLCLLIIYLFPEMNEGVARLIASAIFGWGALFGIIVAAERNRVLGQQVDNERLTQALDLLAKTNDKGHPLIEARVGALYSLEALANTHPMNYGAQVIKTIAAYIYENAQKTARDKPGEPDTRAYPSPLGKDVQTAFAVLKSLYDTYAKKLISQNKLKRLDYKAPELLDDIDFSKADFRMLDFQGVEWVELPTLEEAQLQGANLSGARLQGAHLQGANLLEANLSKIKAQGVMLREANLQGTNLQLAELEGAILQFARLKGADLLKAHLNCSDWRNVKIKINEKELEKEELKKSLQKEGLSKSKIEKIIDVGEHGLWQPTSAKILCDDTFLPVEDNYTNTTRLDPHDAQHNWKEMWHDALHNVPKPIYRTVVEHLIIHHTEQGDSPSIKGLRQLLENK
ncbi:MAG: pentapeptide repeat-containing protein [Alphaproteobacteria bacterium GM202ARS2]|nr:pentapeptide repeat-containing protein [Alphaproteobacteria bacterium GM202ARS2]